MNMTWYLYLWAVLFIYLCGFCCLLVHCSVICGPWLLLIRHLKPYSSVPQKSI
jgi:hypothetical protein